MRCLFEVGRNVAESAYSPLYIGPDWATSMSFFPSAQVQYFQEIPCIFEFTNNLQKCIGKFRICECDICIGSWGARRSPGVGPWVGVQQSHGLVVRAAQGCFGDEFLINSVGIPFISAPCPKYLPVITQFQEFPIFFAKLHLQVQDMRI